ncbi:apoptotic chromatin condensation inducer in the nucleus isoform X1 [Gracilaria domingensis]|nr:apoptotic chromatin condensation inducer in the nucleus isoform X1 [Gracilaria domingensis]
MHKPSRKTLIDRYKRLLCARREQNKINEKASGIAEIYGERENLLDDLILEIDEKAETARREREELEAKELRLIEAGEMIREKALHRSSQLKRDNENQSSASQPSSKKSRQSERPQPDEAITKMIMEQSVEQDRREQQRFTLEQERLEVEKRRAARELERHEAFKLESERRIALEEQRFALERDERKQAMEERRHLLDIMAALSKKLQ